MQPPLGGGTPVKLRDCFLTAPFVPRPASALLPVFRRPLDLSQTFYGTEPLLGVWALDCKRSRIGGERAGPVIASVVPAAAGAPSLSIDDAIDRFCLLPSDTCSATVEAPHRSPLRRILGGRSAPARAGFDHEKLERVDLVLGRRRR